ncbi:helix-turn-helix domain-containing protein [Ruegeria arenilitoris]|uniref:helix-turn-helix domain-containing protein n=1 Tax=Ruegeria arenilitoris TaxID=1173585 RepID=UPI00147C3F7D
MNNRLAPYGQSASQVISGVKLEEAKKLLGPAGKSVGETALRLGYADSTAFSRAFRKWSGMSPSDFKKTVKELG